MAVFGVLFAGTLHIARQRGVLGRGSLRGRVGRDVSALPTHLWFIGALGVMVAMEFGAGLGALVTSGKEWDEGLARAGLVPVCGTGAGIVGGVVAALLARRAGAGTEAGIRVRGSDGPRGLLWLLLMMPALLLTSLACTALFAVATGEPPPAIAHSTLDLLVHGKADPWAWALLAAAIVLGPIAEEMMFRMFLQSALHRALGPWPAVLATAGLFALSHRLGAAPVPWHAIGVLLVLGVGLGAALERTRSIGVPIVVHMAFNAANVVAAMAM